MPSESYIFTTRVDPISPPRVPPENRSAGELVEAPGTAPGSATLIPCSIYRHSRQADA